MSRIFNLKNEYELPKFREYVKDIYDKRKIVEITLVAPQRTMAQNRYLHVLLSYFACKTAESNLEEVKFKYFKKTANSDIFKVDYVDENTGETYYRWRSTRELTTAELSLAIDRFRNWSSAVAGIYLPEANEKGYLLSCQQQIAENKEFLFYGD